MARKNPNSNPKTGAIGFIIPALVISAVSGFNPLWIGLGVLIGLGIGKITSIMGSGLDTTTHNKGDDERRAQEAAMKAKAEAERKQAEEERARREAASKIPLTGDPTADDVITKGLEMIKTIQGENAAIPDAKLSAQMSQLCSKCEQILRTVSETPSKAPQVRKFMNYYLPTTIKILTNYRTMQNRGVSYQEMHTARETTVRGMDMILTACQKQIDNLHRENMMDISTDIDVLEQMLKRDGYAGSDLYGSEEIASAAAEPRTAAEAQMRSTGAPVMEFPEEDTRNSNISSPSYRHKSN